MVRDDFFIRDDSQVREKNLEGLAEELFDERAFEEALFAGDEAEYEAAFQRPGEEAVSFAEPAESLAVPHWTQSSSHSSTRPDFSSYGSQALDDSYSHEARALIDAHDAAEKERHSAAACAEPEMSKPDPLKSAATFGRIYGEIFGEMEEGRPCASVSESAAPLHVPVAENRSEDLSVASQPSVGPAPLIEAPPGYSLGGHRQGGQGAVRGAFRDITDYDASGFGSMGEFEDVPVNDVQPIAFRGLRWIRRNVGNLKVTVSLQRGTPPPHSPRDRKP